MERLTKRIFVPKKERDLVVFTQGEYIDTIPAEMTHEDIRKALRKLAEYEDLEEQGLLLRLPCKVGDTVYRIENGKITQTKITKYDIYADGSIWFSFSTSLSLPMSKFKTCIFLTKEEAEQKLKEMESK